MPGVVAGFPQKAGIVLTSAQSYDMYGFEIGGIGGINPVGSRAIPNSAPIPGGVGEIMELLWYISSHISWPDELHLRVRGEEAQLTFTTLKIGSRSFAKSSATIGYGAGNIVFSWYAGDSNPLPAGNNVIVFE